ncbi:hypothetical protein X736_31460 [Mesorhizobium sp. L2C089B000]|nr:hypothetical protein X736_31460 [Mesorhizobium sp. L2C089B000]
MPTPAQSRLMYFMGQFVHNESIVSKQDIIVGLLDHEGSPTADADELLANLHQSLQQPGRACTRRKRYRDISSQKCGVAKKPLHCQV